MTSVINSARVSTSSLFDLITTSTGLVTDTLESASKGMDILHTKVRIHHASATQNVDKKIYAAKERDLMNMVKDHTDFMSDLEDNLSKDPEYKVLFEQNLKRFGEM